MQSRKLYEEDAYRTAFEAVVLACEKGKNGYDVILDQTAFYPEGGGQPADHGYLNDVFVKDVHVKNGEVVHETDAEIQPGTKVQGRIDFERRFDFMQNHSGEHMVSGVIHSLFGYENVGFHMGEVIQIDFNGVLNWEDCQKVEGIVNNTIYKNMPVNIDYPDEETLKTIPYRSKKELEGQIRIVSIDGIDICACCGTHVKTTGEIGIVKILSLEKHKQGVRLTMLSGRRAFAYLSEVYEAAKETGVLLSKPPVEILEGVRQLANTNQEKARRLKELTEIYFEKRLEEIAEGQKLVTAFEKQLSKNEIQSFVNSCREEKNAETIIVLNELSENRYSYFAVSQKIDLKSVLKEWNTRLNGKGGGNQEMIQGSLSAPKAEIEKVLQELFS